MQTMIIARTSTPATAIPATIIISDEPEAAGGEPLLLPEEPAAADFSEWGTPTDFSELGGSPPAGFSEGGRGGDNFAAGDGGGSEETGGGGENVGGGGGVSGEAGGGTVVDGGGGENAGGG